MGQAQINVRTRACSRTSIARTRQAALTHNVRGKELTHWILDIFSATVSHGLSILGTQRKFGGHIFKFRFLI